MQRRHLAPYLILTTILYGNHKSVTFGPSGQVTIRTNQLLTALKLDSRYLKQYLQILEDQLIISDIVTRRGYISFTLAPPPNMSKNLK